MEELQTLLVIFDNMHPDTVINAQMMVDAIQEAIDKKRG